VFDVTASNAGVGFANMAAAEAEAAMTLATAGFAPFAVTEAAHLSAHNAQFVVDAFTQLDLPPRPLNSDGWPALTSTDFSSMSDETYESYAELRDEFYEDNARKKELSDAEVKRACAALVAKTTRELGYVGTAGRNGWPAPTESESRDWDDEHHERYLTYQHRYLRLIRHDYYMSVIRPYEEWIHEKFGYIGVCLDDGWPMPTKDEYARLTRDQSYELLRVAMRYALMRTLLQRRG
jgi:hypothetical protein